MSINYLPRLALRKNVCRCGFVFPVDTEPDSPPLFPKNSRWETCNGNPVVQEHLLDTTIHWIGASKFRKICPTAKRKANDYQKQAKKHTEKKKQKQQMIPASADSWVSNKIRYIGISMHSPLAWLLLDEDTQR